MSNFNLNKVILGGRLTAEPELRQTQQGTAVCSFSVAVTRRFSKNASEKQTDFINCVAWRNTAEFITRYFHKGSAICLVGSIQTRTWNDQQGQKRYSTEVMVDEASFVDSAADSKSASGNGAYNPYAGGAPTASGAPAFSTTGDEPPKFEEIINDDDLPF